MNQATVGAILQKARVVFMEPRPRYPYDKIITGVCVQKGSEDMMAVSYSSLQYEDKIGIFCPVLYTCQRYFLENKSTVIQRLSSATSRDDINSFAESIRKTLVEQLEQAIAVYKLREPDRRRYRDRYNKVRKLVDLYFEHLLGMAEEFSHEIRKKVIPFLYLPLDKKIFENTDIFSEEELRNASLLKLRESTYGDLASEKGYEDLQNSLVCKCKQLRPEGDFHPIYFDLTWRPRKSTPPRYECEGDNLFLTNRGIPQ